MATPVPLEELAPPQAGVVSRAQLLAAAWSSSGVERALAAGRLIRIHRGVYRVDGAPFTRRAARHAAVLLVGEGAVFSRWTAAELHGLADHRPGPLELVVDHGRRSPASAGRLVRVRRTRVLPAVEQCEVDGLPTTSLPRTLLDLAATTSTSRLGELAATAARLGCRPREIAPLLASHPNAPGRGRLRAALELLGGDGERARSGSEVVALRELVAAGLPRPVIAHVVTDGHGRRVAEVDLAYPEQRIAIEVDGFRWHSSPEDKRRDEERQNALVLADWTVLRFSADDVRDRPHVLVEAVRRALRRA